MSAEAKTVTRLVCGQCGAFLPNDIAPETHAEWVCRCGEDWFVVQKVFTVRPKRQMELPR